MFAPRTRSVICKTSDWGALRLVLPVAYDNEPWGDLACLKDTWAQSLVAVCSAEEYEMACRGYGTPLARVLGPQPRHRLLTLKQRGLQCSMRAECLLYKPKVCVPQPKIPECFLPEQDKDTSDPRFPWVLSRVVLSLAANFFVLIPLE